MNSSNLEKINTETLKFYRKKRSLTQSTAADKIGCTKDTFNRWETGKTIPTMMYHKKLEETLRVTWRQLLAPVPESEKNLDGEVKTQTNVTLTTRSKLSLSVISKLYNVKRADILEVAPLLFHLIAGASLGKREEKAKFVSSELNNTLNQLRDQMPHIPHALYSMDIEDDIRYELEAVINNKIFDHDHDVGVDPTDSFTSNPFSHYIKNLEDQIPEHLNDVCEIEWARDSLPKFNITEGHIKKQIKLAPESDECKNVINLIRKGEFQFKDIEIFNSLLSCNNCHAETL